MASMGLQLMRIDQAIFRPQTKVCWSDKFCESRAGTFSDFLGIGRELKCGIVMEEYADGGGRRESP